MNNQQSDSKRKKPAHVMVELKVLIVDDRTSYTRGRERVEIKQMRRWSVEEATWSRTIELIHKREIGTKKEIQLNAGSIGMKERKGTKRIRSEAEVTGEF